MFKFKNAFFYFFIFPMFLYQ